MANLAQIEPLADLLFAGNKVLIKPEPACTKISLRVSIESISKINKLLGFNLPQKPKTSVASESLTALWLGPDEWLLLDETSKLASLKNDLAKHPCAAIDISHRNTAINVTGANSRIVINAGCPQNLNEEAFKIGACSRTIFGKAEIILMRTGDDTYHLECWRSFSDYVWKYLVDAAKSV